MPRSGLGYLLIGQPSISSLVSRALATKGAQPQYLEARYELGVQALDLTDFEYRYLRRTTTFLANVAQGAVAAQFQGAQFGIGSAGTGRSIVAVLESVTICNENAAAQVFLYGVSNIDTFGATSGPFFGMTADDRALDSGGLVQSAAFVATQSNAGALINANRAGRVAVPAGATVEVVGPWILSGKVAVGGAVFTSFVVQPAAQNLVCSAGFRWYERDLLASEL
jgi:hypothetical protein